MDGETPRQIVQRLGMDERILDLIPEVARDAPPDELVMVKMSDLVPFLDALRVGMEDYWRRVLSNPKVQ